MYPVWTLHNAYHICSTLQFGHMLSTTFTYTYEASHAHITNESSESMYPVRALHSAYRICSTLQFGDMLLMTFTYTYEASHAHEQKVHVYV